MAVVVAAAFDFEILSRLFLFFICFLICSLVQLVFTLTNADKFGKWQTTKCTGEEGQVERRGRGEKGGDRGDCGRQKTEAGS